MAGPRGASSGHQLYKPADSGLLEHPRRTGDNCDVCDGGGGCDCDCSTVVTQAMDATQWAGSGQGNALPMTTKTLDARALLDRRDIGHEFV